MTKNPDQPRPTLDYATPGAMPSNARAGRCLILAAISLTALAIAYRIANRWWITGCIILLVGLIFAAMAIITGISGLRDSQRLAGRGRALSILGICVALLLWVGLFSFLMLHLSTGDLHHETRNRARCAASLRKIGAACLRYASEHNGQFPGSFDDLLDRLSYSDFICPSSNDEVATGKTPQEQLTDFHKPGHCSYVYVGAGLTSGSLSKPVLAYENFNSHMSEGGHVLYANGSVLWFPYPGVMYALLAHEADTEPFVCPSTMQDLTSTRPTP